MKLQMRIRTVAVLIAAVLFVLPWSASAQLAPVTTTLAAAMTDSSSQTMTVASATGITASSASVTTMALIDGREVVQVRSISGTLVGITRGISGTATPHLSGASVVVGIPQFFQPKDKVGGTSCTAANEPVLPVYVPQTGHRWNCIGSVWMIDNGLAVLPASACYTAVSGNSTGTNGYTTAGTSSTPVVQAQTSATGTNTHSYVCPLNAISNAIPTSTTHAISLLDVVATYGVQSGALGTQANVLASGTFNGSTVFSSITYPAPAASETASTVAPVRADSGTLVVTPVAASFNTATTTAGGFYTARFTPAAAFAMFTDLKQYLFTLTLQNTATTATITNLAALIVHFAYIPD